MQTTDTIADLLTRIRNANVTRYDSVEVPKNNMKGPIIKIPVEKGCVKNYMVTEDGKQGILRVNPKYGGGKTPVIESLCGMSEPGLRIYSNVEDLPKVFRGLGIAVIPTSKGAMTDRQVRKENIGSEVLAFI